MDETERGEYDRAANFYLIWPLSLLALAREPEGASTWTRIHTRQAAVYGLLVGIGFVVLMALPLLIVIGLPSISTGATVVVYSAGLVADVVAFVFLLLATLGFAGKAARGELFAIPFVAPLTDRIFRLRR